MSEPVKISSLELENVKRVRALSLEPTADGLTVIGGGNGQGKTSVLDAIAWALGGNRKRPDRPTREGSATPAQLRVELSNGIVVERKGKNGALTVTDPEGRRAGQALLDSFVEELAIDLPRFMAMSDREKADELLGIVGIGEELERLDRDLERARSARLAKGQEKRAKAKVAEDAPWYPEAPEEPVSAADLLSEQQAAQATNMENERLRAAADRAEREHERAVAALSEAERALADASERAEEARRAASAASEAARAAREIADACVDADTSDLDERIAGVDAVNERVRANRERARLQEDSERAEAEYRSLDAECESIQRQRVELLEGADMPLEGLSVEDGRLMYRGAAWGEMSGSEQLRVATAIVRRVKPECGFVLVDKLEQMDPATLAEFGEWAQSQGLQVIGTRVATDETCTVVIEDGRAVARAEQAPSEEKSAKPQMGVF